MTAEAEGVGRDVAGTFTAAGAVGGFFHFFHDDIYVVAIDVVMGHVETAAALGEVFFGAVTLDLGAHGDAVVFDNENGRHFEKAGHVQGFIKCPLVDGAITEEAIGYTAGLLVGLGKGHPEAKGNMSAYDAVPTVVADVGLEEVHRAAFALGAAGLPSEKFGDGDARVHA